MWLGDLKFNYQAIYRFYLMKYVVFIPVKSSVA